jgi:nucleotide-binding universal stress UspA family protein
MTVVVAYSADASGRAALRHGIAEAVQAGERLVVVNATKGESLVDPRYAGEAEADVLATRLAGLPVPAELRQEMTGDAAQTLLTVAEELDARILVVGVRRRSAVGKLILGSVAQRVILDATCPVVAVKPEPQDS